MMPALLWIRGFRPWSGLRRVLYRARAAASSRPSGPVRTIGARSPARNDGLLNHEAGRRHARPQRLFQWRFRLRNENRDWVAIRKADSLERVSSFSIGK